MGKLIGDKKFYKMALAVAVPIMVQNGITNFVGLLDNIMVGQVGTEQMSGVAIVNQLMTVFNLGIFGAISGAGIFGAQFFGNDNHEGVRNAFRFKIILSAVLCAAGFVIFLAAGEPLIRLYLHDTESTKDALKALAYGKEYLLIMLIGMVPYTAAQIYAGTLRETRETVLPMKAGVAAVFINLFFNYMLIFGKLGAPRLGVSGAAYATVISRFVEMGIVVVWTHLHKEKNRFIEGAYKSFRIPGQLVKNILIKGTPLMINEVLWAGGMAFMMQCYSIRGLSVVAAFNISSTITNLFNIVFVAMGSAVSIIVGQLLGSGDMKKARDTDTKLIFFSVASCVGIGVLLGALAPLFPKLYNTTGEVRNLATWFMWVSALCMPLYAFEHASYFTLRSGGKTFITLLFDSVSMWLISIPLAYILSRYTQTPIIPLYFICQMVELIKCVVGFILVKNGCWMQNIVMEEPCEKMAR